MKVDRTEIFRGAQIQYGPASGRIYLMDLADADAHTLAGALIERAEKLQLSKVFAKVSGDQVQSFLDAGYIEEAAVPSPSGSTRFLGAYLDAQRSIPEDEQKLDEILRLCREKGGTPLPELDRSCLCSVCTPQDASAMAEVYRLVFPTYPFPIHDPEYIRETMDSHVLYCSITCGGFIAALSSAEMDRKNQQAEMTDFATLEQWRNRGFARILLSFMEEEARRQGIKTAYTIARAVSPGMNLTFASCGYTYGGRLVNNTQISGSIETMNVWYKTLDN